MIELINLTKKFATLTAVDNLNLKINAGEIFGFLGPNGAGKTTTIKMMVGLLKPTQGTVLINGKDSAHQPQEVKKIIGYIPDQPFLYEKLTAREFLQFVAGIYGFTKKDCSDQIERLLRLFGLEEWGDELIESFSHGMRQRLVLSSALVHNPTVIIVDEPVVGLDPKGSRLVKTVFRNLTHAGVTVFLSTHVLAIAEELCDRIAIIQEGKMIALGTMEELQKKDDEGLESLFLRLTGDEEMSEPLTSLRIP